jgi:two-component system, OmpR family, response regulator
MPATPLTRVFYAEDDEDIQRIVRMSLERIGKMTVMIESDPLKAIEGIRAFKPDLVMLDWMMPGMDGPTLLRAMRAQPDTASYPVVFITAKATQKDHSELTALGAAGIVSKPFSPKDLPEQLKQIWTGLP